MNTLIDFVLHIDNHIINIVNMFGDWTYLILPLIIFVETGLIILPFLPGDSLLFAAAAIAANNEYNLNIWTFIIAFLIASIAGDSLNFAIGKVFGERLLSNSVVKKVIRPSAIEKSKHFFNKHGASAIFLARFMPIIRTIIPFTSANSGISYKEFIKYNLSACITWVLICCGGGYFFGNIPFIQEHFSVIIILIVLISLLPAIIGLIKGNINK